MPHDCSAPKPQEEDSSSSQTQTGLESPQSSLGVFFFFNSALEVAMGKLVGQRDSFQGSAVSLVGANK